MITTPVSDYAAAVRAALAHVPEPDRFELLEDLEDHLTEVAGESGEPLEARLGTPESYAAELYAAYLQRPDQPASRPKPKLTRRFEARVAVFHARMAERFPWYEKARTDFAPAWWLARGYLFAFALWTFRAGTPHQLPWGTAEWLVLAFCVAASVVLGYRARDGRFSSLLAFLSFGVGLLAAFFALVLVSTGGRNTTYTTYVEDPGPSNVDLANIYPYTKDGKPLKDVLLYDQNGNPIQLDYSRHGFASVPGATPQIPNSYPLSICNPGPSLDDAGFIPLCPSFSESFPSVTPPAFPSPTFSVNPDPSTATATPTASPTSTPTE